MSDLAPVHFILGAGRSGTTLLRVMLAGHPGLFVPPEMLLAWFDQMADRETYLEMAFWTKGGLRRALMDLEGVDVDTAKDRVASMRDWSIPQVYAHLQGLAGARAIVDKCVHIGYMPEVLADLPRRFPGARFVWIRRHPGSVIRSFENMPMAEVMLQGGGFENAEEAWRVSNRNIRAFLQARPQHEWCDIRYEDLVQDPAAAIGPVLETLGLPFHPAVLEPYQGDRMREGPKGARAIGDPNMAGRGAIDPSLATKWLDGFDPRSVSGETRTLASALGYELDALALPPMARLSDATQSLLDTAATLERQIRLPMDLDAAEGRRFLLRMLSESIDTFVEYADPDFPGFRHAEGPTRKMFADCPDTDYLQAPVRLGDGRVYEVSGQMPPGTTYLGALLYGRGGAIGERFSDADLPMDEQGRFRFFVSDTRQDGPTLVGDAHTRSVMVRQYYKDRGAEPAVQVDIRLLGPRPSPQPVDPEALSKAVHRSERMLKAIFKRTLEAYKMASGMALNRFISIPGAQLFPTPDNKYQVCWYRFGADQLMFVRGRIPGSRYFGFSLCNAWLESFDYTRHQVVLNDGQIVLDADGRFEICLAHRDPGHPNWLDTAGHHAGYLLARSLLPTGAVEEFEIQVMYEREWQPTAVDQG